MLMPLWRWNWQEFITGSRPIDLLWTCRLRMGPPLSFVWVILMAIAGALIGSTISEFSISSVLWVLEVLCLLYWHIFYQIDLNTFYWLTSCQQCRRGVFWVRYCSSRTPWSFFPFWRISWWLCRSLYFESCFAIPRR